MMKKMKRIQKPKGRYAKILFDRDTPFLQKVDRNKKKYTRKQKYLTYHYQIW